MNNNKDLYVHYGCGQFAPKEWINFDASPTLRIQRTPIIGWLLRSKLGQKFDGNVRFGDILKGLPKIPDNSCKGVYSSHVLEHMSLEDFRLALKNTYSILQPGGRFRLIIPDLEVLVMDYVKELENKDPNASVKFIDRTYLGDRVRPKGMMAVVKHIFGYLKHLWLWDQYSTVEELKKAGFTNIRFCEFNDSEDEMFKLVEDKKRFELCVKVEAIK